MGRKAIDVGRASLAVAQILRARADEAGVTDSALSERSGIPRERLRRSLNGGRAFLVDDLDAVAEALGLVGWQVLKQAQGSERQAIISA